MQTQSPHQPFPRAHPRSPRSPTYPRASGTGVELQVFCLFLTQHRLLDYDYPLYNNKEFVDTQEEFYHWLASHWVPGKTRWCRLCHTFVSTEPIFWVDYERRVFNYAGQLPKEGEVPNRFSEFVQMIWFRSLIEFSEEFAAKVRE